MGDPQVGGATFAMNAWCGYGFVKHGCKKLMGKFHLVLSNPCVTKTISASGFAYSSANGHFQ
jgi:hypothetical protein